PPSRARDGRVVRPPATVRRWVPVVSRVLIRRIMVCRTVVRRWLGSAGGMRRRLVWRRWFPLIGVRGGRRKPAHDFGTLAAPPATARPHATAAYPTTRTLSAWGPLLPCVTSNSTRWPSSSDL